MSAQSTRTATRSNKTARPVVATPAAPEPQIPVVATPAAPEPQIPVVATPAAPEPQIPVVATPAAPEPQIPTVQTVCAYTDDDYRGMIARHPGMKSVDLMNAEKIPLDSVDSKGNTVKMRIAGLLASLSRNANGSANHTPVATIGTPIVRSDIDTIVSCDAALWTIAKTVNGLTFFADADNTAIMLRSLRDAEIKRATASKDLEIAELRAMLAKMGKTA